MSSLFDILEKEHTIGSSDNFMDKLTSVKKDYEGVLGQETIDFAETLVEEYQLYFKFRNSFNQLISNYKEEVKDNFYIKEHNIDFNSFDIEKSDNRVERKLIDSIKSFIERKWSFIIDEFLINPKYETENSIHIDFTNKESILSFISSKTNNGNCQKDAFEQKLRLLKKTLPYFKKDDIKLIKNKISIPNFYSVTTSVGQICISQHCNKKGFYDALLMFIKEDFPGATRSLSHITTLEKIYSYCPYAYLGESILDKQEFTGNGIIATKLFKNCKFEIWFKTDDLAKRFYKDYIMKSMELDY
ncbi:hypothetical protein [Aliarcobacter butzleri]|uniref:hypothetical protein n=1 Tax=Aliarcobacter butzleri TaxID=28197 RepID=UPI00344BB5C3